MNITETFLGTIFNFEKNGWPCVVQLLWDWKYGCLKASSTLNRSSYKINNALHHIYDQLYITLFCTSVDSKIKEKDNLHRHIICQSRCYKTLNTLPICEEDTKAYDSKKLLSPWKKLISLNKVERTAQLMPFTAKITKPLNRSSQVF